MILHDTKWAPYPEFITIVTGPTLYNIMSFPIESMYGIFTYIWLIFMVNVGKYAIHGSYGF